MPDHIIAEDLDHEIEGLSGILEEIAALLEETPLYWSIDRNLITEPAPGWIYEGTDGPDEIRGSRDDDVFRSSPGSDWFRGGTGEDHVQYTASPAGVDVELGRGGRGGHAEGDIYTSIEHLHGSAFDDRLAGNGADNRLWGDAGDDTLEGDRGADSLYGGTDDDVLDGGPGGDRLWGGFGDDDMTGGAGNDSLQGLFGDDTLVGGAGDDTLKPWTGSDDVTGGAGADVFQVNDYQGVNVIRDFTPGEDMIALRGLSAADFLANLSRQGADVVLSVDDGLGNLSQWTFLGATLSDFTPDVLV